MTIARRNFARLLGFGAFFAPGLAFASANLGRDDTNQPVQAIEQGPTIQNRTFTSASAQSSALNARTKMIRLCATQNCWYLIGANPTAATSGTSSYLPAGIIEYRAVPRGFSFKVAVIRDSADGTLNIEEIG